MWQLGTERSLGDVLFQALAGLLALVSGYLFRASITHGQELARLGVKEQADADNIAMVQGEVATVDKRIAESRHGMRSEITALIVQVEDRIDQRFKELREGQESIRRFLEADHNRRKGDG